MPLDGKVTDFTAPLKVEPLSDDKHKAVRQAIALLRGPLPEDFEWDFRVEIDDEGCGSRGCALGWFHTVWPNQFPETGLWGAARQAFDMSNEETLQVFADYLAVRRGVCMIDVTPAMVADDLEAWADEKYGRPQP